MSITPLVLSADAVARLLPSVDALAVMRELFAALGAGEAAQPPQTLTLFPGAPGDFITYLGALASSQHFGAKLSPYIAATPPAVTAWTLLMSMQTGQPLLLCDSKALTIVRTAATTALAVDLLAPRTCSRLAVIGSGAIARAHLSHVRNLRGWSEIRVFSPTLAQSSAARDALSQLDARVQVASDLPSAALGAEVIMLCTSSGTPVLDPGSLRSPALITSISTNAVQAHEVPPAALSTMDVYCDYRPTTPSSAGDMQLAALNHGWSGTQLCGDLAELVHGRAPLPDYHRHAYFRSIGLGLEDIAMAAAIYREAVAR